jgi:RNA polymerase sigma-70 factor, ECF subfamily
VLYGVHRATAARWVNAAREELGEAIRAQIAQRLTISVGQVDSIVRLVQSRIDVSLERLLGDGDGSGGGGGGGGGG